MVPEPVIVVPPSRTEAANAAAPGELPPLHPAGDPVPGSTPVAGGVGGSLAKPGGDLDHHDTPRPGTHGGKTATAGPEELAREGWEPIRHSGGQSVHEVQREVPGVDDDAGLGTSTGSTDPSAHADKEQSFDVESPASGRNGEAAKMSTAPAGTRPERAEGKLDTVLHKVEGRENFWDISRMYYDSGRYYRALWKANSDKVPDIAKLYQGTVIRIPPPEDLDPAYIDPPGKRPNRGNGGSEILAQHETVADESALARSDSTTTNRRNGDVSGEGCARSPFQTVGRRFEPSGLRCRHRTGQRPQHFTRQQHGRPRMRSPRSTPATRWPGRSTRSGSTTRSGRSPVTLWVMHGGLTRSRT